ncbi:MAG: thioesterase family protein [Rhodobacteraceae bacterium]|nr:thioesterase family protein [Paracoccaceae bacterium]
MPVKHKFDIATDLETLAPGRFLGKTSPDYDNMAGPFGGVTSACLLNAVRLDPRHRGDPVSITVNLCAAIANGAFAIQTSLKRDGKYIQHWAVELTQDGRLCTSALIMMAVRQETFSHQSAIAPTLPPTGNAQPLEANAPLKWLSAYDLSYLEGAPGFASGTAHSSTRTVQLVADKPARPLDHLSLLAMSDSFILRIFCVRPQLVPMGTVSMTTHFMASADEIAEQGATPLLGVADATRIHDNFQDQQISLFGLHGRLLASGTQIVWFKH